MSEVYILKYDIFIFSHTHFGELWKIMDNERADSSSCGSKDYISPSTKIIIIIMNSLLTL